MNLLCRYVVGLSILLSYVTLLHESISVAVITADSICSICSRYWCLDGGRSHTAVSVCTSVLEYMSGDTTGMLTDSIFRPNSKHRLTSLPTSRPQCPLPIRLPAARYLALAVVCSYSPLILLFKPSFSAGCRAPAAA